MLFASLGFSVLFPKTWSEFVSCIKRYTSDCLTADQVPVVLTSHPQSDNFFFLWLSGAGEICKTLLLFLTNNRDFRDLSSTVLWETVSTAYTRCVPMKLTSEVRLDVSVRCTTLPRYAIVNCKHCFWKLILCFSDDVVGVVGVVAAINFNLS